MGATTAHDLDIPTIDIELEPDREMSSATLRNAAAESWIAKNPFGFTILHYDDVVAMLRDKRWHSAASKIMELGGITDPVYLSRQRTSILSAEGDEHTRLRRLVGKAFSPVAADRLRPFMRSVISDLVDAVAPAGRSDFAVDICEPYPIPIICELLGAPKQDWKLFSQLGHGRAADLQRQPPGGPADDHAGPGRARRVHARADRGPPVRAHATTC